MRKLKGFSVESLRIEAYEIQRTNTNLRFYRYQEGSGTPNKIFLDVAPPKPANISFLVHSSCFRWDICHTFPVHPLISSALSSGILAPDQVQNQNQIFLVSTAECIPLLMECLLSITDYRIMNVQTFRYESKSCNDTNRLYLYSYGVLLKKYHAFTGVITGRLR